MDARNLQYLFFGLTSAWVIVAAYVIYLSRRESKIRREIERLKTILKDRETIR